MSILLLSLIYTAFIALGLSDPVLGTAWPVMRGQFGVTLELAGVISMLVTGSKVFSGLLTERLKHRFGTGPITTLSLLLLGGSLFGCSFAHRAWQLYLLALVQGIGAGIIDTALNDYVSLHYNSRRMSWLHCFWGLGSTIAPLIMGIYLQAGNNWRAGYRAVALCICAIALLLLFTLSLWKHGDDPQVDTPSEPVPLAEAIRLPGVLSALLAMLTYCAAEVTASLWASSFLVDARHLDADAAASYASLVFIGITAGRLLAGFVADRTGDYRLARIGTCIAAAGAVFLIFPATLLSLIGFFLIGLGCGPVFPCMIHATPPHFGGHHASAIIAMQMAAANVGSALMPLLFGVLARRVDIRCLPYYMMLFFLLLVFCIRRLECEKQRPRT